jgi:hypothetical protein
VGLARLLQPGRWNEMQLFGGFIMKKLRANLHSTLGVMLLILTLGAHMRAQQSDQDPAPATPHRADSAATQQTPQNEARMPASGDITAHEAKTFSSNIVKEHGDFVLKDPITKVSYKLSDPAKAKSCLGKQVKVTGKLETHSNTIQVPTIEPRP